VALDLFFFFWILWENSRLGKDGDDGKEWGGKREWCKGFMGVEDEHDDMNLEKIKD
jgi:hypothetical protein